LEDFGFEIKDCGSAGHKIAKHPSIPVVDSPDYDCGHNQGNHVKPVYIRKFLRFIDSNSDAITEYLK
jgi:hypothetical protein